MRLAVLGDIHGNIEALRSAYEAALREGPDEVLHLGDLGGYAPFVNEVVDFLIEKDIRGVQGNYDYNVAAGSDHCGCRYEDPGQAALADRSFGWTKDNASEGSKEYMRRLPADIRLKAEGKTVALFHATPQKNNVYWNEDRPEKFFEEMAGKSGADIMIYGHTHRPYIKEIRGRVFINAGSTGRPRDGDPRACLAIVDISQGSVGCRFLRVPYDIDRTAAAIIESGLPGQFAALLREAR
jgi:putative phosphoesterase